MRTPCASAMRDAGLAHGLGEAGGCNSAQHSIRTSPILLGLLGQAAPGIVARSRCPPRAAARARACLRASVMLQAPGGHPGASPALSTLSTSEAMFQMDDLQVGGCSKSAMPCRGGAALVTVGRLAANLVGWWLVLVLACSSWPDTPWGMYRYYSCAGVGRAPRLLLPSRARCLPNQSAAHLLDHPLLLSLHAVSQQR